MRSFVLGLLLATAVAHNCRGERDCNPPQVFSDMTITAKPTTPITIIKSKNWDASGLDGPVQEGLRLVRRFLGHTEPTRVFLVAPGGTDADYAALKASYCAYIGDSRTQCMGDLLATVRPPPSSPLPANAPFSLSHPHPHHMLTLCTLHPLRPRAAAARTRWAAATSPPPTAAAAARSPTPACPSP